MSGTSERSSTTATTAATAVAGTSNAPFLAHYAPRALLLFALGFLFSVIIDHLQKEHNITRYPPDIPKLFSTASWVSLSCGFAGCLVGTLYPLLDSLLLESDSDGPRGPGSGTGSGRRGRSRPPHLRRGEWSSVIRCCGGFIGVNYAASKLPWTSSVQVSLTLALLAIGLWFLFDRTWHGFVISSVFAVVGTWIGFLLVSHGAYRWTQADFFGMRSWLPCILYSSCVCFGSIGRQLAVLPESRATPLSPPQPPSPPSPPAHPQQSTLGWPHRRPVTAQPRLDQ
ncbi:Insulin-induced protein 2 protein [Cladochytrium tenue]|nr:Insulin-induced protein 2 protein [Cladochytrium tenue]